MILISYMIFNITIRKCFKDIFFNKFCNLVILNSVMFSLSYDFNYLLSRTNRCVSSLLDRPSYRLFL